MLSLPERIWPTSLGFGGLTDGYLPFEPPGHAAAPSTHNSESAKAQQPPLVTPCSLVMKAVQARLGAPPGEAAAADSRLPGSSSPSPAGPEQQAAAQGGAHATSSSSSLVQAAEGSPTPLAVNSAQRQLQACAVKLGDDPALTKVQTDPRLPHEAQQKVVQQLKRMVETTAAVTATKQQEQALSQVLEEAYVAVVRQGCLQAHAVKQ